MLFKLFQTSHGYLCSTLIKKQFKNPQFLFPISHLHNCSKASDFTANEVEQLQSSKPINKFTQLPSNTTKGPSMAKEEFWVNISHPWPEWVDLMECLLKRGYFEGYENPFRSSQVGLKESNYIRTACLNFARDQYNVIRFLSRKDIQVIAGCGCPSIDRKVVNSGKRLRAHVGIDEGDICSTCNLRGDCERAYVKAREDEGGRTVDVMRFLVTYGLDHITGMVKNRPCLNKVVKESVRRLLKEMIEYGSGDLDSNIPKSTKLEEVASVQHHSSTQEKCHTSVPVKQGDWLCPNCNFLNFARNIKCLRCDNLFQEKLQQLREDLDHLPLKKGDWICGKCNFLNFAKNSRCLICKEKPPKRQLNPGEWECDSCNYINFRRNMVCLKCDHRRPKTANSSETSGEPLLANGGNHENNRLRLARGESDVYTQPSLQQHRQSRNRRSDVWRFVEDEKEECADSNSGNGASGFVDFPIAGGKSNLSQNADKKERWKLEMLERSKGTFKAKNEDEFGSVRIYRSLEPPDLTDDEDMAGWFGHGKVATRRNVSGSGTD
ncbi:zinc finger protein VAR3, chloroplastic [Ziziphus jujuba]|uniref:Zinc finger protein VAR3, chloroplastic n=1 Tax=Ziziphus jujuba TaxID=326968 RepID=A0A6P4AHZ7_ZIZJJ|nr:zinc finger protein VAR3, chloroplastic [Ziziphus jujuba]